MRTVLIVLITLVSLSGMARADDDSPESDFRRIITQQLAALHNGDADGAWAYAHPSIQAQFGSADRFYTMVDRGYRPLIDFTVVRFQPAEHSDDVWIQPVWLRTDQDEEYVAYYALARDDNGDWRIAGCQIVDYLSPGI